MPRFQSGTTHLALVYKDDQLVGFVTLDNLLDALIGKIKDEFHPTKSPSLYTSRKATNNSEHESR